MSSADEMEFVSRAGIREMIRASADELQREVGAKLDELQKNVTALVGSSAVPGSGQIAHNTQLLLEIRDQGKEWHEEDIKYRESIKAILAAADAKVDAVIAEVGTINKKQEQMTIKLSVLNGLILALRAIKWTKDAVITASIEGKKSYAAISALLLSFLALWTFLHSILPAIRYSLLHHKISF